MKRVKMIIHEPLINKVIGSELNLLVNEKTSVIDAISEVDKLINKKGNFPLPAYRSLLHMVYNPFKNRFYKQVALTAYTEQNQMLNVRDNPEKELAEGVTVILIPAGGCISEWEEAVDYKEFLKAK
jgi:hypothetical protein